MGTSAELISSRIRIVADKLDLKSNEAKKKGNENAARALMTSVGHLHDASQFILNLDRQHSEVKALREEISKANDKVDKHGDFSKKIEQVKRMLMKKSEEMEVKGNKNACAALRESAATINQAQEMLLTYATMNAELKRSINFNDSVMKKIKLSLFSENADILKEDEFVSVLTHGANIIKVLREKYEGRSDEEIFNQIRSDEYIVQDSNKGDDKVSALEAEVLRLKEIDEELRIAMMKIGALSEENDRLYADIKVIRNRYDAEHIKLQENEDFLAKKDEEFKSLSDQLNISKSTSDEHMHLISSLQEECKLQHRMAQKAEEQYHQAKIELETLQKTLEENSGKISAYQAELNRSEDKRNDAEAMLAKSKNDIQLLQEELKDLLKIANLNADTVKNSANLENKIKQLNEELIHRRKESTLFEADKKAADDLNHRLVQKCCSIKNTLDEVRMTLMNIRKSKSSVIEQDISSFRSVPEDLKDFLQELISHLKLYRKERVDFSETKEELANMGSRLDAIALSCKDEISRIEDEIIRNKFADVTDSFAIVERSIFVLASSLHQLRTSRLNVEVQPQQELEKLKERADLFEKEAHKAQKRLTEVEKEFDMYRHKSHSALKKIEKRAELLNGMRKDNDLLTKKLREYKSRESEQQHEIECARMRVLQLENICMMTREEMAQRLYSERALIVEEYRKNNELRNQVEYSKKIRKELMVFNENLQEEKNEIARAKMSLHVDESREKDLRIQRLDAELTSKQSSTNDLEQKCVALEAELKEILDKVGTYEHFNAEIIKILDDGNNSLALTNDISLVDQVRKVMIERNALRKFFIAS
jgi:chromosome segregation ATPase